MSKILTLGCCSCEIEKNLDVITGGERVTKLKNEWRVADACTSVCVVLVGWLVVMAGSAALSKLVTLGRFGWIFELFFAMFVSACTQKWAVAAGRLVTKTSAEVEMEERDMANSASKTQETWELIVQGSKTRMQGSKTGLKTQQKSTDQDSEAGSQSMLKPECHSHHQVDRSLVSGAGRRLLVDAVWLRWWDRNLHRHGFCDFAHYFSKFNINWIYLTILI